MTMTRNQAEKLALIKQSLGDKVAVVRDEGAPSVTKWIVASEAKAYRNWFDLPLSLRSELQPLLQMTNRRLVQWLNLTATKE